MGFRFRKSINLGGGFRINFSKSGIGYSWGTKGARFTKTAKGTTRTTIGIPGTGISYVSESGKTTKAKTNARNHAKALNSATERTTSMKWIDFALCFFFGILGVHKFREHKVGMGLLYLFTGGLLGIGWIIDCVKYFIEALKSSDYSNLEFTTPSTSTSVFQNTSDSEIPKSINSFISLLKKHWRWILVIILAIFVLASIPSFSSFLALVGLAFIIPIPKWQALLEKYITSKIRSIAAGVLAVLALFTFPGSADNTLPDKPEVTTVVTEAHIHSFTEATCIQPKTCTDCDETNGEPLGHAWIDATCFQAKICTTCGAEDGVPLGHTWIDATCLRPKSCSVCHAAEGLLGTHTWADATCLAPETCTVCGETHGELSDHNWQEATCIAPQTCSVCSLSEGDTIAHTWEDATCLAPKTCSFCKITEGDLGDHTWEDANCLAPKTCTTCKATEGDLGDHDWEEATCLAPKTCAVCKETEGYYGDCKYNDHICIYCGDEEPTVWIPNSGSKYHSQSSCSRMKNPTEVYLSTAIARGYEDCSKC